MAPAMRMVCNEEGNGNGGISNSNKGGRQAIATRAMVMETATRLMVVK